MEGLSIAWAVMEHLHDVIGILYCMYVWCVYLCMHVCML